MKKTHTFFIVVQAHLATFDGEEVPQHSLPPPDSVHNIQVILPIMFLFMPVCNEAIHGFIFSYRRCKASMNVWSTNVSCK